MCSHGILIAGITGYGDATNNFLIYSAEGALKDLTPYLIGEDPERVEYLWQVSFRRRFMRGGPATGTAWPRASRRSGSGRSTATTRSICTITSWPSNNKWVFRETVVNQYVNYLRPDVCHCGGLSEMKKIAALGEVYYMDLIPHNNAGPLGTAATLHAALAIPSVALMEAPFVNSEQHPDVVTPYPTVEAGFALPLEGPGLGVHVDEELARSRPFRKPGLQPRLNAPDGSVRDYYRGGRLSRSVPLRCGGRFARAQSLGTRVAQCSRATDGTPCGILRFPHRLCPSADTKVRERPERERGPDRSRAPAGWAEERRHNAFP